MKASKVAIPLLLLAMILLIPVHSQAGYDKYLHFSVSFTIYGVSYGITNSEIVSAIITLAIGLAKELGDLYLDWGVFEYGDLAANLAGAAAAVHYCREVSFRPLIIFWIVF